MLEEIQYINHWLLSKEPYYMKQHGIDSSYFVALREVVDWVEKFRDDVGGQLPSLELVAVEFEDFRPLKDLDSVDYVAGVLKEQRAYMDYRPMLVSSSALMNEGHSIEAMWKMRNDLDNMLKKFTNKTTRYDWIANSEERYLKYMEKHGIEGMIGLSTGIDKLDELTGGWKEDDLILLVGRTNEGKSQVGAYFAYKVWYNFMLANIKSPVVYISTEMPEHEVAFRLDTLRAHFSNRALNEGKLKNADDYKSYTEELRKKETSFLIMTQEANGGKPFTPADIRAIIEMEKPGFVVIDQLYDLSDGTEERDIRRKIVNVSNQIREVNLSTLTPTLLIAQAGRESAKEAKKDSKASPEIHQIQESDNPAQKATKVLTMRKIEDIIKLSLKKNRGGPKDKDVFIRADIDTGIWEETKEEELVF
ncbi:DnaB-like helicase C-terminal domain-containing protein [Solibacillus silvestris]